MTVTRLKDYLNWQPVKHTVFKDAQISEIIHNSGHITLNCLSKEQLSQLNEFFQEEHSFDVKEGGMFYSMYSRDKDYRKRVHETIGEILKPTLEKYFVDYKNIINAFVVKLPGEKSEFYVHQDTSALDEFQFSPLSLWIPLHDVSAENGALAIIEKTHWFFSPLRGVTIPFPFNRINETIKKYLKPVDLKAGELLCFDNRIIHNSLANTTDKARIAIVCGVFPKESEFQTCHRQTPESEIEVYKHEEDYMLNYPHFFYNCHDRPVSGNVVKSYNQGFPDISAEEFEELCALNNIPIQNALSNSEMTTTNCQMIAEPDGINRFDDDSCAVPVSKPQKKRFFSFLKRS